MDIVRFTLYVVAPWVPFLLKNELYKFKVWQILLLSIVLLLPFCFTFLSGYSFSTPLLFSISFVLFLISFSTICWLLTHHRRFVVFASLLNLFTFLIFYSINWQTNPYSEEANKHRNSILKVESTYYSDIETNYIFGDLEVHHARKKVLGGLLVKKFELNLINLSDTCMYEGFNDERAEIIYWNKCTNIIIQP